MYGETTKNRRHIAVWRFSKDSCADTFCIVLSTIFIRKYMYKTIQRLRPMRSVCVSSRCWHSRCCCRSVLFQQLILCHHCVYTLPSTDTYLALPKKMHISPSSWALHRQNRRQTRRKAKRSVCILTKYKNAHLLRFDANTYTLFDDGILKTKAALAACSVCWIYSKGWEYTRQGIFLDDAPVCSVYCTWSIWSHARTEKRRALTMLNEHVSKRKSFYINWKVPGFVNAQ